MTLDLKTYRVAIARDGIELDKALEAGEGDGYDVHTVTVLHADQLVAEQSAPRYGLPPLDENTPQKITWATLWIWCALKRMQVGVPEWPIFKTRMLDMAKLEPAPDQPGGAVPDPTQPTEQRADTGSHSPLPESGPESTGSTPTTG